MKMSNKGGGSPYLKKMKTLKKDDVFVLMNKYNAVKRSTAPKRTTRTPADVQKAKKKGK